MAKALDISPLLLKEELFVSRGVVVLDFYSPDCGPCKLMASSIDKLAEEFDGKAIVLKVNVTQHDDLAMQFNVRGLPTIVVLKNGAMVNFISGRVPYTKLAGMVRDAL